MALPPNVSTCKVDLKVIRAGGDTANDLDIEPDTLGLANGTVTIKPSVPYVKDATASPPSIIYLETIECTLNAAGVMIGPDGAGVGARIVATNDPDLMPIAWTYTASIKADGITPISITFVAPMGGALQLAEVAEVPGNPGTELAAWTAAVIRAEAARDAAIAAGGGGGGAGTVTEVNGKGPDGYGVITLVPSDIGAQPVGTYASAAQGAKADSAVQSAALTSGLATKADLVGGLVPTAQLPALAYTSTSVVASQAAMLALSTATVQPGDIAVRTDGAGTFILTAADPTVLGNWTKLNSPTDLVSSVNGATGTVVISAASLGALTASLSAIAGLLTSIQVGIGLCIDIPYTTAFGLATRPSVPTGWHFRIFGGLTSSADPTWMTDGDWRHIPA